MAETISADLDEIRAELKKLRPRIYQCTCCEIKIVRYVDDLEDNFLCIGCSDVAWMIAMRKKAGKGKEVN